MSLKDILKDMLTDERGSTSHKRTIVTLSAFCLLTAFIFNFNVSTHLADLVAGIVFVGMGFTTWDKFSTKKKDNE
jgi:hypothetical protein